MIFHMRGNSHVHIIHIFENWLGRENIWIWCDPWECPNLNRWFINSSVASHLGKCISPWIPLARKFFLTAIHPDTICHKSALFLVGVVPSNKKSLGERPWVHTLAAFFSFCRDKLVPLDIQISRVFPIIGEIPSISVNYLSLVQWYTFYNLHILGIHQRPICL